MFCVDRFLYTWAFDLYMWLLKGLSFVEATIVCDGDWVVFNCCQCANFYVDVGALFQHVCIASVVVLLLLCLFIDGVWVVLK